MGKKIDPEKCIRIAHDAGDAKALANLEKELAALPKRGLAPLSVVPSPEDDGEAGAASWDRQLFDPAIIELLLSLGLPIRIPKGDAKTFTFYLYSWARREGSELDELRRVAKHPFFGDVLVASFFPTRETKGDVGNWLARAVRIPAGFTRVFEALDAVGKALTDTWTIGALEVHEKWLENTCQPAVFERCSTLARAVRELEPWRLLRNQLRAGVLDEWGWPAYEEALDSLPVKDQREIATNGNSGVLPYKVLLDQSRGRVVVIAPDRIVMDRRFPALKKMKDVRQAVYVSGDVLVCEYPMRSHWLVKGGAPFRMDAYLARNVEHDGGIITWARTVMRPGDRKPAKEKSLNKTYRIWCDGPTYYAVPQGTRVSKDGKPAANNDVGCETFDPKTGKTTGNALPAWMANVVGDGELYIELDASFTSPAPKGAERSPLGAKDGLGGFALYARDHTMFIEGVDGRKASGLVNGLYTVGLMTFPEREGFYPIVQSAFEIGIALPDGTPLVPMNRLEWNYWQGTPGLGKLVDWLSLVPRDPKASRALSKCSDDAAKAIYAAARPPSDDEDDWLVLPKEVVAAVPRALPEVRHPRLIVGIAGLAQAAHSTAGIVTRLKSRAKPAGPTSSLTNDKAGALSRLFEHDRHWWVEKLGVQLGQQMLDVSHFLFDDALESNVATPAPTVVPWPLMLERMGDVLYRIIAPGTPKARRAELIAVLGLWLETGFPTNLSRVRMIELTMSPKREELAGLDRDHSQRLVAWKNRYFLHFAGVEKGVMTLSGVEVAHAKEFATPEGAKVVSTRAVDTRWDAATIRKTLAIFAERGTATYDRAMIEQLAKKAKLSKTASTLLWCAGYDPWFIGDAKQARFAIARDDIDPAEKELKKLALSEIYARAMPDDPAQMYDGAVMAERLATAMMRPR